MPPRPPPATALPKGDPHASRLQVSFSRDLTPEEAFALGTSLRASQACYGSRRPELISRSGAPAPAYIFARRQHFWSAPSGDRA